ncbi:MAG TPA: phosphotransferase [Mycobacteriales bacterium]|nr:phosphotransferase [Mycobacteriales bacterium]
MDISLADAISGEGIARMVSNLDRATLVSYQRMGTGIANDVFRVECAGDRTVVLREVRLQRALLAAGLRTPLPLPLRSGDVVGQEGNRAFIITEYLGESSQRTMTEELATDFGRTLAKFHRAVAGIELNHRDWLHPAVVNQELDKLKPDDRPRFERLLAGTDTLFTGRLPTANIHGDLYLGNVLAAGNRINVIFDLETAECNVRLLDIAQSAMNVAETTRMPMIRAGVLVLDGYAALEKVASDERSALPLALRYTATASAIWLHNVGSPRGEIQLGLAASVDRLASRSSG